MGLGTWLLSACPGALPDKGNFLFQAHFGGAEFTPALGTLQLNDCYLNTHFFLNKLTEVKSESLETNGAPFFSSSKTNHKFWWD